MVMEVEDVHALGLGFAVLGAAVTVVWRMSRVELSLRADHSTAMLEMWNKHNAAMQEMAAKVTDANEKIYKVEIWARDEFVRKGSFDIVVARMEKGMETLGQRIEGRLEAMSQRIEKITHE
jgi:4-hydroxyphenylpyruvate dioxygenase-like putative hemolysin